MVGGGSGGDVGVWTGCGACAVGGGGGCGGALMVQLEVKHGWKCLGGVVQLLVREIHGDRLLVVVVGHGDHGKKRQCLPEGRYPSFSRSHQWVWMK